MRNSLNQIKKGENFKMITEEEGSVYDGNSVATVGSIGETVEHEIVKVLLPFERVLLER